MATVHSDKVFGVPLAKLMARPGEKGIPQFVRDMMRHLNRDESLKTQGLFRVSAAVSKLEIEKKRLDDGEDVDFTELSAHMVAALLKAWLIELPEPLLTFKLYDQFIAAIDAPEQERVERLKDAVRCLPAVNKAVADAIFLFMRRVREYQELNHMTAHNVSIVFAQILLRPETDSILLLKNANKTTNVLLWIIENYYEVFARSRPDAILTNTVALKTVEEEEEEEAKPEDSHSNIPVGMLLCTKLNTLSQTKSKKGIHLQREKVITTINEMVKSLEEMSQELEVANDIDVVNIAKRLRSCNTIAFECEPIHGEHVDTEPEASGVEAEESVSDMSDVQMAEPVSKREGNTRSGSSSGKIKRRSSKDNKDRQKNHHHSSPKKKR